jgi:hypothetical protein
MYCEQDRDEQDAERQSENPALPEVARFPQSSEADPKNEDDDEKVGDVESDSIHGLIHGTVGNENPCQPLSNRELAKATYDDKPVWVTNSAFLSCTLA